MADTPRASGAGGRSSKELARLGFALLAGGLVAAFAVLNTGDVKVNWVFGTFETPLIIVILVCLGIGLVVGLASARFSGSARQRRSRTS
jgi:lipopolysaccharide assembly protein A